MKPRFKCPECDEWFTVDDPDEQGYSSLCLVCQDRMDDEDRLEWSDYFIDKD